MASRRYGGATIQLAKGTLVDDDELTLEMEQYNHQREFETKDQAGDADVTDPLGQEIVH